VEQAVPAIAGQDTQDTASQIPLVVDVDGTLVKSDLLHESAMLFLAHHPLEIWRLPLWSLRGRQIVKGELAARTTLDIDTLPLRAETVARIRAAQAEGRPVYLASASDHDLVKRLAARIGGIAGTFGSDRETNVAGAAKAVQLDAALGPEGYDYIGDRPVDFDVWRSARRVIAVAHSHGFARRVLGTFPDAEIIARPPSPARAMIRALRPHQWTKNLLVFLSLVAGHHLDLRTISETTIAFLCFCMAASSAYILNDLLDLQGDRAHTRKRLRPFAAGDLPITTGIGMGAVLMAAAVAASLALSWRFSAILVGYVVLTLAYSLALKRRLLVDVMVLAGLYTIRVLGGVVAAGQPQSQWLLMFSLFLFLCLATVKRCSELVAGRESGQLPAPGRAYSEADLTVLFPLAAAAGYGAVLIVMLYMSSAEVARLYTHPLRMWLMCPLLLYWVSRVLIVSNRNAMHDDPVVFAFSDRISWATVVAAAAIIAVSI
jgi:4-hydroxybenzoate polyprenyltransferase